jgi:hypothetical protein
MLEVPESYRGNSEAARALAAAEKGWLRTKRENGITPIIEIVEALGIVLRQDDKHFF